MHVTPSKKLLMAAAVVIMLNFTNCTKYDEGPGFTIIPAQKRLVGEWEVVKAFGQPTDPALEMILEFEKDGDFGLTYSYGTYSYTYGGTWEFEDKNQTIEITVDGQVTDWDIKKLTSDELWFEDETDNLWECDKQK